MLARIFRPAKNAMQSGRGQEELWVLEYEPEMPLKIDPLMGYTSSTDMRRQILDPSAPDQERAILDVLAALCDRKTFPAMAGERDVPDADPRCSRYLK